MEVYSEIRKVINSEAGASRPAMKFAWIPTKRLVTPIHHNGFLWLERYWDVGGKAYKNKP